MTLTPGSVDIGARNVAVWGLTVVPSGKTTHGFIASVGNHDINVYFSFTTDPPAAGSHDFSELADFAVHVDFLTWHATYDARYDSSPEGSLTVRVTGGSDARLIGSLDAVAVPTSVAQLVDAGGDVAIHLEFP